MKIKTTMKMMMMTTVAGAQVAEVVDSPAWIVTKFDV